MAAYDQRTPFMQYTIDGGIRPADTIHAVAGRQVLAMAAINNTFSTGCHKLPGSHSI
jgi:hypothetical protein